MSIMSQLNQPVLYLICGGILLGVIALHYETSVADAAATSPAT